MRKRLIDQNLVKNFNRIFYEIEADIYDVRHPEVVDGDRQWWGETMASHGGGSDSEKSRCVIDIGSGTGFVGDVIHKHIRRHDNFICYDLSTAMLEQAKGKLRKLYNGNVYFISGEADYLPFRSNSIDLVTINALLHHLKNLSGLFTEIDRVLVKGGYIIIAHEPNKLFFESFFKRVAASFYKLIGCGKSITDDMEVRINNELKKHGFIEKDLSKDAILRMVEFHSPVEQSKIMVKKEKGFIPQKLINSYFLKYKIIELREYTTYFIRPIFKKMPRLGSLLKMATAFLFDKGNLFCLILQK